MSKAISYFDWEINFRKKSDLGQISEDKTIRARNKNNVNSLGISEEDFKIFMKKWKNENL